MLGSTGKHYTVTLEDERQACECADYRFRRHHCKHLRLVLQQLGIPDSPETWHEVRRRVEGGRTGREGLCGCARMLCG